ncbi:MAG: hypothetical protein JSV43_03710 [Methanobacteriota archaeon]|nr:MAG: hypothetical protein JSV43_03710 [Euryarchaeota archaeon]
MRKEPIVAAIVIISVTLSILSIALIYGLQNDNVVSGTGTVKFISLEGGFFGILGDDGEKYDPINLDEEFQVDGLRVIFIAKICENQVSFHMWGTLVEIVEIHILR